MQIVLGGARTGLDIQQGIVDLIIAPGQINEWLHLSYKDADSPYDYEMVLDDRLVCIAAVDDPAIGERIDLETYLEKQHASFNLRREIHASLEIETVKRLRAGARRTRSCSRSSPSCP